MDSETNVKLEKKNPWKKAMQNFELLWKKYPYPPYSFLLWKALFLSQEITGADHEVFNSDMISWNISSLTDHEQG